MITREEAREIAEHFLRARGPQPGWEGVDAVRSFEEVETSLPPALRATIPAKTHLRHCWVVSTRGGAGGIIYISREDGEIKFAGAIRGGPHARSG